MKNNKKETKSTQHAMKRYNIHLELKFKQRGEKKIEIEEITKKKKKEREHVII